MRSKIFVGLALMCAPATLFAQSAVDAMSLSQQQLKGTARFMAMGGAFTALGGDLSTLGQNPGGIGIYRNSEIGLTLDLSFMNSSTLTQGAKETDSNTRFTCNNFGYVGAIYTGSDVMPYFNWGVSYSRAADFNRAYHGSIGNLNGSLTNYIAGSTTYEGWKSQELNSFQDKYNPYWDSSAPWMSILAYNTYLINQPGGYNPDGPNDEYVGLWQNGTSGHGTFDVRERGYVDEYNIDFGGNFSDVVYWGIGFGITDIDFTQSVYYTEDLNHALITNAAANGVESGNGGFGLDSWKKVSGTGFNFKAGVILRPINELRIGLAVHTPTYYNLSQQGWAAVDYGYSSGYDNGYYETDDGYVSTVDWKLRTPWRLMAGIAGVIGNKAILSLDYEYRPYKDMTIKSREGSTPGYINDDITEYYQSSNIVRIGAEYRLDRSWSVRAGYNVETTPTTRKVRDNDTEVYTTGIHELGTTPSYSLDNSTQNLSFGLGYRYKNFYADAAYVWRHRTSEFHAYSPNAYTAPAPQSEVTENFHNVVLSLGFRF